MSWLESRVVFFTHTIRVIQSEHMAMSTGCHLSESTQRWTSRWCMHGVWFGGQLAVNLLFPQIVSCLEGGVPQVI